MPEELKQKFEQVNTLMTELTQIRKRSLVYGMFDLSEWLEKKLDRVNSLMDEIEFEVAAAGSIEIVAEQEDAYEHATA